MQIERALDSFMDRLKIEPGGAQTLTNETDEAAHARFAEFFRERRGKAHQRVCGKSSSAATDAIPTKVTNYFNYSR